MTRVEAIVQAAYAPWTAIIGQKPGPLLDDYCAHILAGRVYMLRGAVLVVIEGADHMLLDNVAVHPDQQGRGIGRGLIAFAENLARSRDHQRMRLYAHEKMTTNIALYRRLGYTVTHRARERGLDRVYMEKQL
ncbi:MAG: GNAT family N-acetyltransferase [Pseudomonadota bacterium]